MIQNISQLTNVLSSMSGSDFDWHVRTYGKWGNQAWGVFVVYCNREDLLRALYTLCSVDMKAELFISVDGEGHQMHIFAGQVTI